MKLVLNIFLLALSVLASAVAEPLLPPAGLEQLVGAKPTTIKVFEPHLSVDGRKVVVEYVGFPINAVLSKIFGRSWQTSNGNFYFHAKDGYVSSISPQRLEKYKPLLVFRRKDGKAFTVDNPRQHEKNVPLGPYYLVWDNISNEALFQEGAYHWPYQINEIKANTEFPSALIPNKSGHNYAKQIKLAQKYCLTCHQINGTGGKKFARDLVISTKKMQRSQFMQWVTAPEKVKAGTSMPPINTELPSAERNDIASHLYDYLIAFPKIN
jgi:hypothetical protein